MGFKISMPRKNYKSTPRWRGYLLTACAIGAFIGFHGQKRFKKNSDLALVMIYRLLEFKLKYDVEGRVLEKKMAD
jgi:hypothetical protein